MIDRDHPIVRELLGDFKLSAHWYILDNRETATVTGVHRVTGKPFHGRSRFGDFEEALSQLRMQVVEV